MRRGDRDKARLSLLEEWGMGEGVWMMREETEAEGGGGTAPTSLEAGHSGAMPFCQKGAEADRGRAGGGGQGAGEGWGGSGGQERQLRCISSAVRCRSGPAATAAAGRAGCGPGPGSDRGPPPPPPLILSQPRPTTGSGGPGASRRGGAHGAERSGAGPSGAALPPGAGVRCPPPPLPRPPRS